MKLEEQKRMAQGWRGRRFLACHAADQLERVIENLGRDNGADLPPPNGLPEISDTTREEIKNQAAVLLRMILAANDGLVSPQRLRHY